MFQYRTFVAGLAFASALAIPAKATTSYSSSSAMQTANSGLVFTNVSFDSMLGNNYSPTLDMGGGLTFTGTAGLGTLTVTNNPGGSWPSGAILKGATSAGEIDIVLPTGTLAFGASVGEIGNQFQITVSGNGDAAFSYTITPSSGSPVYIGISSSTPFTSIQIAPTGAFGNALALNNFSYGIGSISETPEPSTLAMIGSGLLILPLIRRRRARAKSGAEPCP